MAHIIYGVAGEGSGHSSRARVVIPYLQAQGFTVHVVTYHKGVQNLAQDFDVTEVFGLRFAYENNTVSYPKTVLKNIKNLPEAHSSLKSVQQLVKKYDPVCILTDFEPLTALVAYLNKIPLISIDNQHRITHGELEYESRWRADYLAAKAGVLTMAFNAQYYIITSFFDIRHKKDKNVYVVPPLLRDSILTATVEDKGHVLVYTTSGFEQVIPLLKNFPEVTFMIYGLNKDGVDGNCIMKKPSTEGFINDLRTARAVIGNAGFTLMTESLYLHKPYCAFPVKHQFEQLINAYYLEKYNYGTYMEEVTVEGISGFLKNIEKYKKALSTYKQDGNKEFFDTLKNVLNQVIV